MNGVIQCGGCKLDSWTQSALNLFEFRDKIHNLLHKSSLERKRKSLVIQNIPLHNYVLCRYTFSLTYENKIHLLLNFAKSPEITETIFEDACVII